MLKLRLLIICLCLFAASTYAQSIYPKFSDYRVSVLKGKKMLPTWLTKKEKDCWRDRLGKCTTYPEINFAGRYLLAGHSCGTYCRYFSLTNFASGRELNALDRFTTDDNRKYLNGREYIVNIHIRPNRRLLIAQYQLQDQSGLLYGETLKDCREQSFVLKGTRLRPVTKIVQGCRQLD